MDEKVIIHGELRSTNTLLYFLSISIGVLMIGLLWFAIDSPYRLGVWDVMLMADVYECGIAIDLGIILLVLSPVLWWTLSCAQLTVTDKRVYGKVAFGKRVDLPVDSISAIAVNRLMRGVAVSSSAGRISFLMIQNADEIYATLSNLLIARQNERGNSMQTSNAPQISSADELKKYKELLDNGVISQEEFDAKKKQLLGL